MLIRFQKPADGRRWSAWEADRGKRRIVRGGSVWSQGRRLSHDLAGYAVERALGLQDGFWHCVADGATFHSTEQRITRGGRLVIAGRRAALQADDLATHRHWDLWEQGLPTPAAPVLDEVAARWEIVAPGQWLTVSWDLPQRYAPDRRRRRHPRR